MTVRDQKEVNISQREGEPFKSDAYVGKEGVMPWIDQDVAFTRDQIGVTVIGRRIEPQKGLEVIEEFHERSGLSEQGFF
jgi:hypothetical protein